MRDRRELFRQAADIAAAYRQSAVERPVGRTPNLETLRKGFHRELPSRGIAPTRFSTASWLQPSQDLFRVPDRGISVL